MIGKMLGNLKIVSKIGEGGMGVVYLAENLQLNNRFAVKSLAVKLTDDPSFRERFRKEALNQALLSHPNIVQAIDFFDEDGQFFLVMEYVSGQALDKLIKQTEKLSEEETLRIFKDILRGLNFAHSKGVIHRDIKPQNVIVDDDGRARITDFGIAILVGEKRLTSPGATVGSSWYMSPEQILRPKEIDHRSDVYSAGIVLYEMLTGDVPFDGESEFTIQNKQVKDVVPDPAKKNPLISSELKKIMMKALEKDPDKRYSGCGEFLKQIEEYEKSQYVPPPPTRWKFVVAAIALIGIVVVAYKYVSEPAPTIIIETTDGNAYDWIKDAQENVSLFCKQIEAAEGLRKLEQITIDSHQNDAEHINYVNDLKSRMKERENRKHEYLNSYLNDINKLSSIEKDKFDQELGRYNEELAKQEQFARINITKIVAQHYYLSKTSSAKFDMNMAAFSELCPKQNN